LKQKISTISLTDSKVVVSKQKGRRKQNYKQDSVPTSMNITAPFLML